MNNSVSMEHQPSKRVVHQSIDHSHSNNNNNNNK